jgi:hypothetical protein
MDYTNVNEKSEFQLNVGFWMGVPQGKYFNWVSFIRGIHFYIVMMKLVNLLCCFLL